MLSKPHFSEAINWWTRGLGYLCPASIRKRFNAAPDLITIEFMAQEVIFKRYTTEQDDAFEQQQFNPEDNIERVRSLSWLQEQRERKALVTLIIPDDRFLKKKMALPIAASSDLRQVLSFEMNRKTPFNPEQVYFDYLIVPSHERTDKVHLELFLVPREQIEPHLETLTSWDVKPDTIRPVTHQKNNHINLIAPEERSYVNAESDKTLLILTATTCLLFMAMLYAPILGQQKQLSLLETAVTESRKAAVRLQSLQQEKEKILAQSHFLENKQRNEMSSIALINEVTQIIPDDTWLSRLVLKSGALQLQGESSHASSLIQTLESSQYFTEVQFRSPVTQNKISQKDKFHLSATFTRETL
jgi:general secretion pathway protein L